MKKSILKSAVVMVALSGMSFADAVFKLDAQHFYNSLKTEVIASKYELPNVYVSTNLNLQSDTYDYKLPYGGGYFDIELKETMQTWNMTLDFRTTTNIVLYDENGKSFIIAVRDNKVYFDNKDVYSTNGYLVGTVQLSREGSEIKLQINGSDIATTEGLSFGSLKTLKTKFVNGYDYLHSLIIASN